MSGVTPAVSAVIASAPARMRVRQAVFDAITDNTCDVEYLNKVRG